MVIVQREGVGVTGNGAKVLGNLTVILADIFQGGQLEGTYIQETECHQPGFGPDVRMGNNSVECCDYSEKDLTVG